MNKFNDRILKVIIETIEEDGEDGKIDALMPALENLMHDAVDQLIAANKLQYDSDKEEYSLPKPTNKQRK